MQITFLGNFNVDFSSESHHAKSLEQLGHTVLRLQEGVADGELILNKAMKSDLFIWVHTHSWRTPGRPMKYVLQALKDNGKLTLTYHLDLWFGLQRQNEMMKDDYWHIGHFFTVDKKMADWLNENTDVKGHYLPAGVFQDECYSIKKANKENDVVFVGSREYHPEWQYRPQLIDWLKINYNQQFKHYGRDGICHLRGYDLNLLYANSKIAVGDSLCLNFDYPFYWSDRIFETIGRGGFIIHPYIKGLEDCFEIGKELVTYEFGNFADLKEKIEYYLSHEEEREQIRLAGFERVLKDHTYLKRWEQIIAIISGR